MVLVKLETMLCQMAIVGLLVCAAALVLLMSVLQFSNVNPVVLLAGDIVNTSLGYKPW